MSGVRWFYPKDESIQSTVRTSSRSKHSLASVSLIVFGSWTVVGYFLISASIPTLPLVVGLTTLSR